MAKDSLVVIHGNVPRSLRDRLLTVKKATGRNIGWIIADALRAWLDAQKEADRK